jgi:hypothetical protein
MIIGTDNISEVFSIFHDGHIISHNLKEKDLTLSIRIRYLAERINPHYQTFQLSLRNARNISFKTWPSTIGALPEVLSSTDVIFTPELEILNADPSGTGLTVICNQPSPHFSYCGGELSLEADSAEVLDEGGKPYSLAELGQIAEAYWRAWSANHDKK